MSSMRLISAWLVTCALSMGPVSAEEEPTPPGPQEALKNASAVFVGKVTAREREGAVNAVTFEVSKSWKGPRGKTIKLLTPTSGAFDGYRFRDGETYLVYCLPRREDADESAPLWTNGKTRTCPLSEADADIEELGEPRADDAGDSSP
ncbi:MAG: hypothetical protein WD066_06510 [Planctomycetaceae bacterium]